MSEAFHARVKSRLSDLQSQHLLRSRQIVDVLPGGLCRIDGRELINFGANDYLGLAHEVGQTFAQSCETQLGATASALVAGHSRFHAQLEDALAAFERTEAALLFPTGYAANLGVLSGLVEANDAVFCDRDNHASIIDAARACPGKLFVYRRDRLERLHHSLSARRGQFKNTFLVTDGVFSMDGTVAPLADLCDLAEEFDAPVIVDEAHGTGVIGHGGRGASEHCEVEDRVMLRVGTMSKAMGGLGGFVVGHRHVIELLRNTARTQFFSTALPPPICAAMLESLNVIQQQPQRRQAIRGLTAVAHDEIQAAGLATVFGGIAPIVPVIIGGEEKVLAMTKALRHEGFFVPAIRSPTVRQGTERLRMSFSVHHSDEQIRSVMQTVTSLQKTIEIARTS